MASSDDFSQHIHVYPPSLHPLPLQCILRFTAFSLNLLLFINETAMTTITFNLNLLIGWTYSRLVSEVLLASDVLLVSEVVSDVLSAAEVLLASETLLKEMPAQSVT